MVGGYMYVMEPCVIWEDSLSYKSEASIAQTRFEDTNVILRRKKIPV